jgi:hypothetical protein
MAIGGFCASGRQVAGVAKRLGIDAGNRAD